MWDVNKRYTESWADRYAPMKHQTSSPRLLASFGFICYLVRLLIKSKNGAMIGRAAMPSYDNASEELLPDLTNEAANVAAVYITLRGEDTGTAGVFFFRCVVDRVAFFRVDLALRYLVEEGSNNGAATVMDSVIVDNILLQLL